MKNKWLRNAMALVLVTGFLTAVNQGFAQNRRGPVVIGEISQAEAEDLVFMREEEKLARDVYLKMFEMWQNPVFSNIANSEQNHMDAIKRLIDAYGLVDPILEIGVFSNPDLQILYDQLIGQGALSELDALKVGALIEEVDISDLAIALNETTSTYIQQVYQRLMAGSENHLRAFVRSIELQENPYFAQFMSQEEVDQILSSTNMNQGNQGRRGINANNGQGLGQGQGRGRRGNWANRNAARNQNQDFVDADGDGICDLTGTAIQSNQKNKRSRGSQSGRRGR